MNIEEASKLLSIIADPNRLTIINILTRRLHVSANEFLPYISCKQATLSIHLKQMVESGILNSKKKGTKVFYSLDSRKYEQLGNFLGKIDRINKTEVEKVKPSEEKPIRVIDTPIVSNIEEKDKQKESLPTFLL